MKKEMMIMMIMKKNKINKTSLQNLFEFSHNNI